VLLLPLVLQACGTEANFGLGRLEYILVIISHHLLVAKKKHTRLGKIKSFVKNYLLKPETWKAAIGALDFGLRIYRVALKVWEYLS